MSMAAWKTYIDKFNANDEELIQQAVSNKGAVNWLEENIPLFECPDKTLEETYYFRWWVLRKHIKQTPEGYIVTEFLPPVYWAGPYNSINCAVGHHMAELRWLRDTRIANDYARFWFLGSGNIYAYSSWVINALYEYACVKNNYRTVVELLPQFISYYAAVEETNMTRYGLFWSYDDRDAMELSISGSGLRPTLNSYMYANALAIAAIAQKSGDAEIERLYRKKAQALMDRMYELLWDEQGHFFKVIPQNAKDDVIEALAFDQIAPEQNVRESIGYIPWSFHIPQPNQDCAWRYLRDDAHFAAPFGPTTAERCHPRHRSNESPHECQWNGPSWPYATTQILNGMIATLQNTDATCLTRDDFFNVLTGYSNSHFRTLPSGEKVNWLDENLDSDTGEWLSRRILEGWGWRQEKGGYERGKDYNHSAFCDLIIRGVCGIQISEDNVLRINPLLPPNVWAYFMLKDVHYKGHTICVIYDEDGTRYEQGSGLQVLVDNKSVVCTSGMQAIEISLD